MMEAKKRALGPTESNWCKAVHGGTGIAVLAIHVSSKNLQPSHLQNALNKLQNSHPVLRSRLHTTNKHTFSFVTSPTPFVQVKSYGISSTNEILESSSNISPLQQILEHELNKNAWIGENENDSDLLFASAYSVDEEKWVIVLRLHVIACDHTTATSLLRELLALALAGDEKDKKGNNNKGEVSLGIEELVPKGKGKKSLLSRGMDMLGYSLNSFRLTHLKFDDVKSARCSKVVRFQLNEDDTKKILLGCESNGIRLSGALTAAGLMAAHGPSDRQRKYAVITLIDCRAILDPPLSDHHFGFYHSAIMNTHVMKGSTEETFWEVAKRSYKTFTKSVENNRHFTDMADLNFLMNKAMENPSLTPSATLRTTFMTVFDDTVIDDSTDMQKQLAVDDYIGCASAHGIGPSIGMFDTIRCGRLDCVCVYPHPLHSREQMQVLVDTMETILVDAAKRYDG